ncbi:FmdB family zinc ribbon protein [Agromyces atrinae]|uniref:Putative FmdB family regulatory protein n=1 Tax=Agromyces atrinae TaxID=592376 RepID=A0A4Q2M0J6_9MICO|nr:zinc ribbon domain-containing protein [Agromyces atrinae]NYD66999.1 putative FmdB family regulatory protein [Agromyces atrinae]RXZ85267.1 zinc ribbon domain-containing protein [Agromyces atrinae]RXZ85375.1 zinc ribbon domain-containing protein [Agromyces atrinae]
MPRYEFRCTAGHTFDAIYAMADVPDRSPCTECGADASRRPTAPHLGRTGSAAFGLIDRAARSADAPEVVSGAIPGASSRRPTRYTDNPAHQKLPRL